MNEASWIMIDTAKNDQLQTQQKIVKRSVYSIFIIATFRFCFKSAVVRTEETAFQFTFFSELQYNNQPQKFLKIRRLTIPSASFFEYTKTGGASHTRQLARPQIIGKKEFRDGVLPQHGLGLTRKWRDYWEELGLFGQG